MRNLQAFGRAAIAAVILSGACVFPASALAVGEDVKATEEAVEKAAQEAVEKAAEEVLEKAVEEVTEKAEKEAAEKAGLKAKRPDEWKGPTTVHFFVFVLDIDAIDDANQSFSANVYVRLRWTDKRLADPEGATRQMPLEEVWNPQVLLANRVGVLPAALPQVVEVKPDGTVQYRQRYTGQLSQPLNLSAFPMDKHTFTIHFISTVYAADQLEFVPDVAREGRNGPRLLDSCLSVFCPHMLWPDHAATGHITLPSYTCSGVCRSRL